jgi:PKD domain
MSRGYIDEVSVYPTPLTAAQVAAQWTASGRSATSQSLTPHATFAYSASWLAVAFDASASASAVPSGSVGSYAWDFGDGTAAGSGPKPSHT